MFSVDDYFNRQIKKFENDFQLNSRKIRSEIGLVALKFIMEFQYVIPVVN